MASNRKAICVMFFLVLLSLYYTSDIRENILKTFDSTAVDGKTEQSIVSNVFNDKMSNIALSCNKNTRYLPGYVTDNRDEELIVYSELGKCGSGTLVSVITAVCRRTGVYSTRYFWPIPDLNPPDKRHRYIKDYILSQKKPFIFMGHLRFVDFTEFGYKQPIYIDWTRDPVERLISLYYYQRRGTNGISNPTNNDFTKEELNRPLEECIEMWINESGCNSADDVPTCLRNRPSKSCRIDGIESVYPDVYAGRPYNRSREVLINMAKSNIERYYIFIGLNELYEDSVKGLEKVLGFKDEMSTAYKTMLFVNVGQNKSRPSIKTIDLLKTLLADDYKIFEFIRQRLYVQLKCLGIVTSDKTSNKGY